MYTCNFVFACRSRVCAKLHAKSAFCLNILFLFLFLHVLWLLTIFFSTSRSTTAMWFHSDCQAQFIRIHSTVPILGRLIFIYFQSIHFVCMGTFFASFLNQLYAQQHQSELFDLLRPNTRSESTYTLADFEIVGICERFSIRTCAEYRVSRYECVTKTIIINTN